MLVELMVENYAVIESLRVRFESGFNVLTGETGSGKSLVVDALGLLLGGRAAADMIRTGATKARVAGIFEVPAERALADLLAGAGVEAEDGEIIVEREILPGGKSRAFLMNRPVSVSLLRQMAPCLADIHGQHDQQDLFQPQSQLDVLDTFAGLSGARRALYELYRDWRARDAEIEQLDRGEQEKLRLADLWSFQVGEIEAAALRANEDAELEAERRILANSARLEEGANAVYGLLYDASSPALAALRQARRRIGELARIDASLESLAEVLQPAEIAVEEVSHALRSYIGALEHDPARLEHIESRLAAIEKLRRKYGPALSDVLRFLDEARASLAALESAGERRAALEKKRAELAGAYLEQAEKLSTARKEAAAALARRVRKELGALAMGATEFTVQFSACGWSPAGIDSIVFLISPNPGEEPRPLHKIASGGELSRLALALKTCLAGKGAPAGGRGLRTLVFDEVDAGIGGATAGAVGKRLKQLSAGHQLLCVTHLAQIAGYADHHFAVEKCEKAGRSSAAIRKLEGDARTREIGRMLSGELLTPEALRHAEQLLQR